MDILFFSFFCCSHFASTSHLHVALHPLIGRKIKAAVSGMDGELAELLDAAEADGVRNLEEILRKTRLLMHARKMCQGEQQAVQCGGDVHEL